MGFGGLCFDLQIIEISGVMEGFGCGFDDFTSVLVQLDYHRAAKTVGLTQKQCQNIFVIDF